MKRTIHSINFYDVYTEEPNSFSEMEFTKLKSTLTTSFSNFSFNTVNSKLLLEVNELMLYSHYGSKKDFIIKKLEEIPDDTVQLYITELTKHILDINGSLVEMNELFDLWKNDKLVNVDLILSCGLNTFEKLFNGYTSNTVIQQLVNTLSRVTSISNGKGEFLLAALSHQICKRTASGDLTIKDKNIELKTTDVGSARFSDHKVKPLPDYFNKVATFRKTWGKYLAKVALPATGLSIGWIYTVSKEIPDTEIDRYFNDITCIFKQLFPNQNVKSITDYIKLGELDIAKHIYAFMNINYYKSVKTEDNGILYLNIAASPCYSVYFETNHDLHNNRLSPSTNTFYPIVFNTDSRDCYPQITIRRF